jgi:hypothetical protein
LGIASIPLLLVLLVTVTLMGSDWRTTVVFVLWISCILGALAAGILGALDARRAPVGGTFMSWAGILIGGVMILALFVLLLLAIFVLNKPP